MKAGAYDFVEKPFSSDYLTGVVQRALEKRRLTFEVHELRRKLEDRQGIERVLIGHSARIEELRRTITEARQFLPGRAHRGRDRHRQGARGAMPAPTLEAARPAFRAR